MLHRVEAEHREMGLLADLFAVSLAPQGVTRVFDDHRTVFFRQGSKGRHVGGVSREAHGGKGLDPGPDLLGGPMGTKTVGEGAHVGKTHLRPGIKGSVARGGKGERRSDHFVSGADPGGPIGPVQRRSAAGKGHGVPHPQVGGHLFLEDLHHGALGKPVSPQHRHHGGDIILVHPLVSVGQKRHRHPLPISSILVRETIFPPLRLHPLISYPPERGSRGLSTGLALISSPILHKAMGTQKPSPEGKGFYSPNGAGDET